MPLSCARALAGIANNDVRVYPEGPLASWDSLPVPPCPFNFPPPLGIWISFTLSHSSSTLFLFLLIFLEPSFVSCFLCLLLVCLFSPLRFRISEFPSLSTPGETLPDSLCSQKVFWHLVGRETMSRSTAHIGLRPEACRMSFSSWGQDYRKCLIRPWVGRATLVLVVLMVLALWATWEGWGFGLDTFPHTLSHPPLRDQGVPTYITAAFLSWQLLLQTVGPRATSAPSHHLPLLGPQSCFLGYPSHVALRDRKQNKSIQSPQNMKNNGVSPEEERKPPRGHGHTQTTVE